MLEDVRVISESSESEDRWQTDEPLSLQAACIAESLAVERCAIEYTTASGNHCWAASTHDDVIRQEVLKIFGQEDRRYGTATPISQFDWPHSNAAEHYRIDELGFLVYTPLVLKSGTLIGRLWLGDRNSKTMTPALHDQLKGFARVTSEMIYQQSHISRLVNAEAMSGTGSWTWRASNGRVYGSAQFWQSLGIEDVQFGMSPSVVLRRFRKEDRHKIVPAFKTAIETHSPCSIEVRIGEDFDETRHAVANMRIDVDLNGDLVGVFGTLQDITDHKRVEKLCDENRCLEVALRAAHELADQHRNFVSLVCHEFRTPLAIIDGNARRVERSLGDSASQEPAYVATKKIRSAVKRLTGVIERFLCAARFEAGRTVLTPDWLDLGKLLNEISATQLEIASSRQIELESDCSETKLFGDRELLHYVFTNLIANALKYSPEKDKIWVYARYEDDAVTVSVRDEGVGIPEDELDKVYHRFFRASTSAGIVGTGYGLHIVKEFVELHGGSIHLTSKEGEGSSFSVRLPINPPVA